MNHAAKECWYLGAVLAATVWLPGVAQGAGLTITPPTVDGAYAGAITLNISGLSAGQSVLVESFLDADGSDVIDAGEPLVLSFTVTDGQALSIGGVRDRNVPGDEDGIADGRVRTMFDFQALSETNRVAAHFLHRVSAASGGFAPVSAVFVVTQPAYGQRVMGRVTSGSAGVPYALVFLQPASGNGILAGTLADRNGNFSLTSPAGTYPLAALRSGFLFGASSAVTIAAGATVTQNLTMIAADRTIRGRLSDAASDKGIGGVQLFSSSNLEGSLRKGWSTLTFTDANGDFVIPVVAAEEWGIEPAGQATALVGYLMPRDRPLIDTRVGDVSGVSVRWMKAAALVYGSVRDESGNFVADVRIDGDNQFESRGVSDANGDYFVPAAEGDWRVGPDEDELVDRGYVGQGQEITVATGEARRLDLMLRHVTAHLRGRVTDSAAAAVDGAYVFACGGPGDGCPRAVTAGDGSFDIGVVGGSWHLSLSSEDLAMRDLLGVSLGVTVIDGEVRDGLDMVLPRATAHILGSLTGAAGTPIPDVGINAFANIGGTPFNTFGDTDSGGNFRVAVIDGAWQISFSCDDLTAQGYRCVDNQSVMVAGSDRTISIVAQAATCSGDCHDDGEVTVEEIILMVNIALGAASVGTCAAGDVDHNGEITVDEIIVAVNRALAGCGIA